MKIDSKDNRIDYLFILICICALIPLFLLSIYNNPANDDYTYALRDANGNVFATIIYTYFSWSARYFSTAIAQINPLVYHSFLAYKLYPVILITIFCLSFYYLFYSLFRNKLSLFKIGSITAFFILLFLFQTPSTSEAFYWFSGYAAFTVPAILSVLLLALLGKEKKLYHYIIGIIITVCIIGGNEVSAVIIFCFLLFINYIRYHKSNKIYNYYTALFLVSAICLLIVILSPGNSLRSEGEMASHNILWTLGGSILQSLSWFIIWGQSLILASIIYVPLFGIKIAESNSNLFSITFKQYFSFFIITLFLAHIPPMWGLGTVVIGRIANVLYLFFLLSWFYGLQLFINRYITTIRINNNQYFAFIYIAVVIAFTFNNLLNINNNIITSYVDLITGKAENYDKEIQKRNLIIQNNSSNQRIITLQKINNAPGTIYFNDISNDENYWANRSYKEYWNCKSKIKIKEGTSYNCSNFEALKSFVKDIRKNNFNK